MRDYVRRHFHTEAQTHTLLQQLQAWRDRIMETARRWGADLRVEVDSEVRALRITLRSLQNRRQVVRLSRQIRRFLKETPASLVLQLPDVGFMPHLLRRLEGWGGRITVDPSGF
jgi:hypothetical protein